MPELTCIVCPLGCRLIVEETPGGVRVQGNGCRRGIEYAASEITDPRRVLTSVVRVVGRRELLPVKTAGAIPKGSIFRAMEEVRAITARPPVCLGEVITANLAGTGVPLVATKNIS